MKRPPKLLSILRLDVLAVGVVLLVVGSVIGAVGRRTTESSDVSPNGPVQLDGLTYTVADARALDENGDAPVLRALPPGRRHATRRDILYAVFLSVANPGNEPRPAVRRVTLLDADGHLLPRVPLSSRSAYTYDLRSLAPGRNAPPDDSPPAEDLGMQGYALVFRVPRGARGEGPLTLRLHDPVHPGRSADTAV